MVDVDGLNRGDCLELLLVDLTTVSMFERGCAKSASSLQFGCY